MQKVCHYKLYHEDMRVPELYVKNSIEIEYNLFNNTKNICTLCKDLLHICEERDEEYILVPIDLSFEPLGVFVLNYYNVQKMKIHPKEVFTDILLTGAIAFYLVKYTPNELKIESNDISTCNMLQSLGVLFDIDFVNFVVMNKTSHISLKEK